MSFSCVYLFVALLFHSASLTQASDSLLQVLDKGRERQHFKLHFTPQPNYGQMAISTYISTTSDLSSWPYDILKKSKVEFEKSPQIETSLSVNINHHQSDDELKSNLQLTENVLDNEIDEGQQLSMPIVKIMDTIKRPFGKSELHSSAIASPLAKHHNDNREEEAEESQYGEFNENKHLLVNKPTLFKYQKSVSSVSSTDSTAGGSSFRDKKSITDFDSQVQKQQPSSQLVRESKHRQHHQDDDSFIVIKSNKQNDAGTTRASGPDGELETIGTNNKFKIETQQPLHSLSINTVNNDNNQRIHQNQPQLHQNFKMQRSAAVSQFSMPMAASNDITNRLNQTNIFAISTTDSNTNNGHGNSKINHDVESSHQNYRPSSSSLSRSSVNINMNLTKATIVDTNNNNNSSMTKQNQAPLESINRLSIYNKIDNNNARPMASSSSILMPTNEYLTGVALGNSFFGPPSQHPGSMKQHSHLSQVHHPVSDVISPSSFFNHDSGTAYDPAIQFWIDFIEATSGNGSSGPPSSNSVPVAVGNGGEEAFVAANPVFYQSSPNQSSSSGSRIKQTHSKPTINQLSFESSRYPDSDDAIITNKQPLVPGQNIVPITGQPNLGYQLIPNNNTISNNYNSINNNASASIGIQREFGRQEKQHSPSYHSQSASHQQQSNFPSSSSQLKSKAPHDADTEVIAANNAPRCDKFTPDICVDDFEYPEQAIIDEIQKKRDVFELMYAEVKDNDPLVDGIPRDVEESYNYDYYHNGALSSNSLPNLDNGGSSKRRRGGYQHQQVIEDRINQNYSSPTYATSIVDGMDAHIGAVSPTLTASSSSQDGVSSSTSLHSSSSSTSSDGFVCPSEVMYGKPKLAKNKKGQWKVIVNAGEYTQTVRLEKCLTPNRPCNYVSQIDSRCAQVYSYSRLLVFEKGRGFYIDMFRLPSNCNCHIRKRNGDTSAGSNKLAETLSPGGGMNNNFSGNNHGSHAKRNPYSRQSTPSPETMLSQVLWSILAPNLRTKNTQVSQTPNHLLTAHENQYQQEHAPEA